MRLLPFGFVSRPAEMQPDVWQYEKRRRIQLKLDDIVPGPVNIYLHVVNPLLGSVVFPALPGKALLLGYNHVGCRRRVIRISERQDGNLLRLARSTAYKFQMIWMEF